MTLIKAKATFIVIFVAFTTSIVSAQYVQTIPESFLERMTNDGKTWTAVSYERVQVSGSALPLNTGSVTFKGNRVEFVDSKGKVLSYTYKLSPGVVDPLLTTDDKKVYEVRFIGKPPMEFMRLRCVDSPSKLHYLEDITYRH